MTRSPDPLYADLPPDWAVLRIPVRKVFRKTLQSLADKSGTRVSQYAAEVLEVWVEAKRRKK